MIPTINPQAHPPAPLNPKYPKSKQLKIFGIKNFQEISYNKKDTEDQQDEAFVVSCMWNVNSHLSGSSTCLTIST
jgi:hypothetical protein